MPVTASSISTKFLKERPEVARKYRDAIYEAIDWINSHNTEARKLFPKYLSISEEVALGCKIGDFVKVNRRVGSICQKVVNINFKEGELPKKIRVTDLFLTDKDFK